MGATEEKSSERRIKPLETAVVNRIAAGEIIVAPANALKELLENSLDAGATRVEVVVKDGGLKLLQITDDGHGIHKEDLPLLCQRFATSKIDRYEDLENIATYGFRGEALASISHVARLSVVTKRADSACAWRATYSDGELKEVKPTAGKTGTQIVVEDLFYNVPSRLRSVKGGSEELSKLVDVAGRYAVHTEVGIGVKKFGESHFALSTRPGLNIKERIRAVFGNSVAADLIHVEIDGFEELGVIKVSGQITNPNYNNKKSVQPVFFINGRLVSNDVLKRALNSTIQHFLPKGHKPFIYLSLMIKSQNLDVNVHPTKREVRFLHEDEIIDKICLQITDEFVKVDSSRSFPTQTLLPHNQKRKPKDDDDFQPPPTQTQQLLAQKKPRYDYNLVRTDASQAKITTFMRVSDTQDASQFTQRESDTTDQTNDSLMTQSTAMTSMLPSSTAPINSSHKYTTRTAEYTSVNLQSILDLRTAVELDGNTPLTEMFANMSYIGIVDSERRLCALQHDVKLMLVDYGALFTEFFYQLGLQEFSNFGVIRLSGEKLGLRELLEDVQVEFNVDEVIGNITEMTEMLEEYFSIGITGVESGEPTLSTLPLMMKGYVPSLSKLPLFLYRLGAKVNWEDEQECLQGIVRQLALLYVPDVIPEAMEGDEEEEKQIKSQKKLELNELMENVLMPAVKRKFLAPHKLKKDVIEIANLPGLYRVFERC